MMRALTPADLDELFEHGLVYRHDPERWQYLEGLEGPRCLSPRRTVMIGNSLFTEELIQPTALPLTMSREDHAALTVLASAWGKLVEVQRSIIKRAVEDKDERFQDIVERVVPSAKGIQALRDCGYARPFTPFVRLDALKTEEGWKVIDINSTRPAGVGDQIILSRWYASQGVPTLPIAATFCEVVRRCFQQWSREQNSSRRASIAIVIPSTEGDWHNFRVLGEELRSKDWVERCDLIEEVPSTEDHTFNTVLRSRIKEGHPQFARLLSLPISRFCVVSPPCRRWIGDKHWLYFIQQSRLWSELLNRLTHEEFRALISSMPETGVVTHSGWVTLPDGNGVDIQAIDRARWMVKPPAGSSGKGIVIGHYTKKYQWDNLCSNPGLNGALLQRFYRTKQDVCVLDASGSPTSVRCYLKYGIYCFDGMLVGIEVMARPNALVHGARNTYYTTVIVEE